MTLKADIFDLELRQPVWMEGFGESILDENKTIVVLRAAISSMKLFV
jgi:hypothetical protein